MLFKLKASAIETISSIWLENKKKPRRSAESQNEQQELKNLISH